MKHLPEHGAWTMEEMGNTGVTAVLSAKDFGGNFKIANPGRTRLDHISFSISPADAAELGEIIPPLADNIPPLDAVIARNEQRGREMAEELGLEQAWVKRPGAPVVHHIEETGEHKWTFRGGDLEVTDLVIGGLRWASSPEQLIMRIDSVAALIFRAEPFRLFGHIAANKPQFAPKKSIWDRTVK